MTAFSEELPTGDPKYITHTHSPNVSSTGGGVWSLTGADEDHFIQFHVKESVWMFKGARVQLKGKQASRFKLLKMDFNKGMPSDCGKYETLVEYVSIN